MSAASQFEIATAQISNLDRCNLCGASRAVHGVDWTCSPGFPASNARLVRFVIAAGLLALAGVAVLTFTSTTNMTLGSLAASACLAGLTLFVCGAAIVSRRR